MHALTRIPGVIPTRRLMLSLLLGLALLAPTLAFADCVSTVTRYLLLGYEVWRTETMICTKD